MSSTRKAKSGAEFRQERFASSTEFQRGLMANLVAKRCERLEKPEDRELIWFLQLLSHREGGLKQLTRDLVAKFPDRNSTESMRRFGMKPGQIYSAAQVKTVRAEIPDGEDRFRLKGEMTSFTMMTLPDVQDESKCWSCDDFHNRKSALRANSEAEAEAGRQPQHYSAETFIESCRASAEELPRFLAD